MPNIFSPTLVIALLLSACSSSKSNEIALYRSDANTYCNAHSVDYWQSTGKLNELNAMRPAEKAAELMKTFRQTVQTNAMATIIFDEGGKLPAAEFYPYLQKEIAKLTGQPFDCPAIPSFYMAQ